MLRQRSITSMEGTLDFVSLFQVVNPMHWLGEVQAHTWNIYRDIFFVWKGRVLGSFFGKKKGSRIISKTNLHDRTY